MLDPPAGEASQGELSRVEVQSRDLPLSVLGSVKSHHPLCHSAPQDR